MRRTLVRVAAVIGAATLALLAVPAPASAHVSVSAASATQGSYAKLTFRVPNERADASTVKVEVNLPADAPVASVSVKPLPGWTVQTEKSTLATPIKVHERDVAEAITKITWTATADASIGPGQFQEFDVSVGPLPAVDQLVFKTLQTYSGGDIVRWIDEPKAGANLEHPAPVLKLAKAAGPTNTDAAPATATAGEDDSDGSAGVGLGIAGLVLGAAGLVVGLLAYRKASAA